MRLAYRWARFLALGCGFALLAPAGPFALPPPSSVRPLLTTLGDPASYVVTSPSYYDGVARLVIEGSSGTWGCSGALVSSVHILTTAHCLTDASGNLDVISLAAYFPTAGVYFGASYSVHPYWDGDVLNGYDVGLVRLSASPGLNPYPILTTPVADVVTLAGYGTSGNGSQGWTLGWGTLRAGTNWFEGAVWAIPGEPYAFDFDDGTAARDTLCLILMDPQFCETYTAFEVHPGLGDSGGPTFWNGSIVSIHSFIATFGSQWGDLDDELNGTFGELAGDTRVDVYSDWILSQIPEPGSALLVVSGLVAWVWLRRESRRRGSG